VTANTRWYDVDGLGTTSGGGTATAVPFLVFDPADWPGYTVMNVHASLTTTVNQTGCNFAFRIYAVAFTGTTTTVVTLGSQLATVTITAPSAASENHTATTDVAVPAADTYMIAVANGGTTAAASITKFTAMIRLG
jgi:hypothetical protein